MPNFLAAACERSITRPLKGAAVIDSNFGFLMLLKVDDFDLCSQWQAWMGGGHLFGIESLSVGCLLTLESEPIPRRLADLNIDGQGYSAFFTLFPEISASEIKNRYCSCVLRKVWILKERENLYKGTKKTVTESVNTFSDGAEEAPKNLGRISIHAYCV
jgi:hypothetical protein